MQEIGRMTPASISPVLSGELMARATDVVDAEFEEVLSPRPPVRQVRPAATVSRPASAGMDILSSRLAPPSGSRRGGPAFWSGGIMLALAAFWISGGYAAFVGPAIAPAAVFTLSEVSSRVDLSGHRAIVLVDGKAANDGATAAVLPDLEIRVADLAGGLTRYRLGTSSRNLEPGERFAFSSRLDAPKDGVKSVAVSFAE
jgi:hypothetical protein